MTTILLLIITFCLITENRLLKKIFVKSYKRLKWNKDYFKIKNKTQEKLMNRFKYDNKK